MELGKAVVRVNETRRDRDEVKCTGDKVVDIQPQGLDDLFSCKVTL